LRLRGMRWTSTFKRREGLAALQDELPQQEARAGNAIGQASDAYIRQLSEELGRLEVQRDVIIAQNDPAILGQAMYQQRLRGIESQIESLREKLKARSAEFISSFLEGRECPGRLMPFVFACAEAEDAGNQVSA